MPLGDEEKQKKRQSARAQRERAVSPKLRGASKLEKVPGGIGTVQQKGKANRDRAKQVASEKRALSERKKLEGDARRVMVQLETEREMRDTARSTGKANAAFQTGNRKVLNRREAALATKVQKRSQSQHAMDRSIATSSSASLMADVSILSAAVGVSQGQIEQIKKRDEKIRKSKRPCPIGARRAKDGSI